MACGFEQHVFRIENVIEDSTRLLQVMQTFKVDRWISLKTEHPVQHLARPKCRIISSII